MYLEISMRQSGKTTRLINQICADKDRFDIQILFVFSNAYRFTILNRHLITNDNLKVCTSYEALLNLLRTYYKIESVKLYVDEFAYIPEFYNNFNDLLKNYKDIIYDGYFTSTMSADINGAQIISKLIKLNENKYFTFNVVYNYNQ